jgi:aspartate kinase
MILVQKFGGTSLATEESRSMAVKKVKGAIEKGYRTVVVVSAMGRRGEPYATDTLLGLINQVNRDLAPREADVLLACGEIISGSLMAGLLQGEGFQAIFLTGGQAGIVTDSNFNNARILRVVTDNIRSHLDHGRIVVVAGFQGVNEQGDVTTLGRGGSDTTAAALGAALGAEAIEIYTDVDGVKTADPRIVAEARTLSSMAYNEVCQLAHEGARVIHPRAVEIAMQGNIPLRILNTFGDGPGTLVARVIGPSQVEISCDCPVTGITQVSDLSQIVINGESQLKGTNYQPVFESLAAAGISLDFINVNPHRACFTVKQEAEERAVEILGTLGVVPVVNRGCAKVAAVGAGMTGVPGIMARIVTALSQEGIEIIQSTDSYTTIWCLVREKDMGRAVIALHRAFGLG